MTIKAKSVQRCNSLPRAALFGKCNVSARTAVRSIPHMAAVHHNFHHFAVLPKIFMPQEDVFPRNLRRQADDVNKLSLNDTNFGKSPPLGDTKYARSIFTTGVHGPTLRTVSFRLFKVRAATHLGTSRWCCFRPQFWLACRPFVFLLMTLRVLRSLSILILFQYLLLSHPLIGLLLLPLQICFCRGFAFLTVSSPALSREPLLLHFLGFCFDVLGQLLRLCNLVRSFTILISTRGAPGIEFFRQTAIAVQAYLVSAWARDKIQVSCIQFITANWTKFLIVTFVAEILLGRHAYIDFNKKNTWRSNTTQIKDEMPLRESQKELQGRECC